MYLPAAAKLGLRFSSISIIAPLISTFALQPAVAFTFLHRPSSCLPSPHSGATRQPARSYFRRHLTNYCKMAASSDVSAATPAMFSSAKDARAFVAETVLTKSGQNAVKCGELACQRDSFQTTLDGTKPLAYAIFEEAVKTTKKKKGSKNKKKTGGEGEDGGDSGVAGPQLVLALSDSILYPEGGGQPFDTGKIVIKKSPSSAEAIVLPVIEVTGMSQVCLLTCPLPVDGQEHIMEALQSENVVDQVLDWERRFDLMTQHSAQHLISAVALSEPFDYDTHSFSLSTKSDISYVDLLVETDIETEVHRENAMRIEQLVNENIRNNLPMTPRYVDEEDLIKAKESGEVRSRLLPEGITGRIRLVEIGLGSEMVDQNTCGGTHVQSLGQLQMVKFFKLDRVKSNILRVYFAAGKRLMNTMNAAYKQEDELTNIFSCTESEIVGRVNAMVDDRREKERVIQKLNEKMCYFQAKEIVEMLNANDGVAVIDLGDADMQYKTILANTVAERRGDMAESLLLMIGGSEIDEEGSFLLVGDEELVEKTGKLVAAALEGRGGGRGGKFQGKGNNIRKGLEEARRLMLEAKV